MEFDEPEQLLTETNELDDLLLKDDPVISSGSSSNSLHEEDLNDDYTAVQIPEDPYTIEDDPINSASHDYINQHAPSRNGKLSDDKKAFSCQGDKKIRKASGGQFL